MRSLRLTYAISAFNSGNKEGYETTGKEDPGQKKVLGIAHYLGKLCQPYLRLEARPTRTMVPKDMTQPK